MATHPRSRSTDPPTSHQAAARADRWIPTHSDLILGVLWRPMSPHRIAMLTGLTVVQVDRRLPELEREGKARPTGKMVTEQNGTTYREWEKAIGDPTQSDLFP